MKRISILIFAVGLLLGCDTRHQLVEEQEENGGKIAFVIDKKSGLKDGEYTRYTSDGKVVETANYRQDRLHGERVIYYPSGDPELKESYVEGEFEGPYLYYYEEGGLEIEGKYTEGVMAGIWKRYYQNGQLMEAVEFADNMENGKFIEYHENGKLKAEGTYLNGDNEHGLLKLYDENGELYKTMDCENGTCRTKWLRDDSTSQKQDAGDE